jgi:predicted esterase
VSTKILAVAALAILSTSCCFGATGAEDVADVPCQDLKVKGQTQMRYFLIGPARGGKAPAEGYSLLVIMPGGDGSADFNVFVRRMWKFALPAGYIVAEPVAPGHPGGNDIVWPAAKNNRKDMPFSTQEFIEAVIKEVGAKHRLNSKRVFTLSWSSSGPTAYAIALQDKTAVTGSFVAMSVWDPNIVPEIGNAKGLPFYIYHSPDDATCRIAFARQAAKALRGAGGVVKFVEYPGGHGWTSGSPYDDIRAGIEWLENPTVSAEEEEADAEPTVGKGPFTDSFETGQSVPDGWAKGGNVPGVNYIWDKATASDGKASICLEKTVKKFMPPIAGWLRSFDYDGKSPSLTVSAKVKAAKVTKAIIDVQFYDAKGASPHEWASYIGSKNSGEPPADHDWKDYSGTVKIPNGTKTITIALQIYGPGKVWFDELKVEYAK